MDALPPGHVVGGKYRIEELLGRGGAGAVYRATQLGADRRVALKVLARELVAEPTAMQRFGREAELVQRLAHPNAVTLLDYGSGRDGVPFIAFELLRGHSLEALVRAGPMPMARVARLAAQALRGLSAAHALGIVHRDVKPSNLFVCDYPGQPDFLKVIDFGIAKGPSAAGSTTLGLTREGHSLGTPSYMAPEQVRQESVGPAADIYSLGLVISEALSGREVFGAGSRLEICMAQIADTPARHPSVVLDSALGHVVARATEKRPTLRYASAAEMLLELEAAMPEARPSFVAGSGIVSTAPPPTSLPAPHTVQAAPARFGVAQREVRVPQATPRDPGSVRSRGPSTLTLVLAAAGLVAATAVVTAIIVVSLKRDTAAETAPSEPGPVVSTGPAVAASGAATVLPDPEPPDPQRPDPTPTTTATDPRTAPFPNPF